MEIQDCKVCQSIMCLERLHDDPKVCSSHAKIGHFKATLHTDMMKGLMSLQLTRREWRLCDLQDCHTQ